MDEDGKNVPCLKICLYQFIPIVLLQKKNRNEIQIQIDSINLASWYIYTLQKLTVLFQ